MREVWGVTEREPKELLMRTVSFIVPLCLMTAFVAPVEAKNPGPLRAVRKAPRVSVSSTLRTRTDLKVLAMGKPAGAADGCLGRANKMLVQVANYGGAAARPSSVRLVVTAAKRRVRAIVYSETLRLPRMAGGSWREVVFDGVNFPRGYSSVSITATVDAEGVVSEQDESNNALSQSFSIVGVKTCSAVHSSIKTIKEPLDLRVAKVRPVTARDKRSSTCIPRVGVLLENMTGAPSGRPTVVVTLRQINVQDGVSLTRRFQLDEPLGAGERRQLNFRFSAKTLYRELESGPAIADRLEMAMDVRIEPDPRHPDANMKNNARTVKAPVSRFLGVKQSGLEFSKSDFHKRCAWASPI